MLRRCFKYIYSIYIYGLPDMMSWRWKYVGRFQELQPKLHLNGIQWFFVRHPPTLAFDSLVGPVCLVEAARPRHLQQAVKDLEKAMLTAKKVQPRCCQLPDVGIRISLFGPVKSTLTHRPWCLWISMLSSEQHKNLIARSRAVRRRQIRSS